jgi:hypothetical protein
MKIQNFLSEQDSNLIKKIITSSDFKWNYRSKSQQFCPDNMCIDQYVHSFYNDAFGGIKCDLWLDVAKPLIIATEKFLKKSVGLNRLKANMLEQKKCSDTELLMMEHQDWPGVSNNKHYSIVYYVGKSDGPTVLFDSNHKILNSYDFEDNAAIIFDSHTLHRGTPPVNHKNRFVVNMIVSVN